MSVSLGIEELPDCYQGIAKDVLTECYRGYHSCCDSNGSLTPEIAEEVLNFFGGGLINTIDWSDYDWLVKNAVFGDPDRPRWSRNHFSDFVSYLNKRKGFQSLPPAYRGYMRISPPEYRPARSDSGEREDKQEMVDSLFSLFFDQIEREWGDQPEVADSEWNLHIQAYEAVMALVRDNPSLLNRDTLQSLVQHFENNPDMKFLSCDLIGTVPVDSRAEDAFINRATDLSSVQAVLDTMDYSGRAGLFCWLKALYRWDRGLSREVEKRG